MSFHFNTKYKLIQLKTLALSSLHNCLDTVNNRTSKISLELLVLNFSVLLVFIEINFQCLPVRKICFQELLFAKFANTEDFDTIFSKYFKYFQMILNKNLTNTV